MFLEKYRCIKYKVYIFFIIILISNYSISQEKKFELYYNSSEELFNLKFSLERIEIPNYKKIGYKYTVEKDTSLKLKKYFYKNNELNVKRQEKLIKRIIFISFPIIVLVLSKHHKDWF